MIRQCACIFTWLAHASWASVHVPPTVGGTSPPRMGERRERRRREEEEEEDQKEKKEATTNNHVDIAQQYNHRAMKGVGSPESWLLVLNEVERQACWAPRHIPQTL